MKKGPFKLRSGNNPDMQELSGVSPMKIGGIVKTVVKRFATKKATKPVLDKLDRAQYLEISKKINSGKTEGLTRADYDFYKKSRKAYRQRIPIEERNKLRPSKN